VIFNVKICDKFPIIKFLNVKINPFLSEPEPTHRSPPIISGAARKLNTTAANSSQLRRREKTL
jgi:hypothetical protein